MPKTSDERTSALFSVFISKTEELAMELKKDYTIAIVTYNMQQAVRMSANTAFFLFGEVWNATIQKNCFQYRKIKRQKITLREDLVN